MYIRDNNMYRNRGSTVVVVHVFILYALHTYKVPLVQT